METQDGVLISLCNSDQDQNERLTLINHKDGFPLKNISQFAVFYPPDKLSEYGKGLKFSS